MSVGYCPHCGAKLPPDALFCSECGADISKEKNGSQQVKLPTKGFCSRCGTPLLVGAICCSKCGVRVSAEVAARLAMTGQNEAQPSQQSQYQPQNIGQTVSQLGRVTGAPTASGEFALDLPEFSAAESMTELMSPFRAVFSGATRVVSGLKSLHKNPKALITAAVMAVLWIVFMLWDQSERANKFTKIMSFLTFAKGGSVGTIPQMIGGLFGKGVVISAVMSLFGGGLRTIPASFKNLFSKGMDIGMSIMGLGLAVTAYKLFAGYAGTGGAMVGVCGAALSFGALGGGAGYLRTLAVSLTSKKRDGVRSESGVKSKSLLTGLTAGFVLAAALSKFDYTVWIPVGVAAVGLILAFIIPEKGGEGA